MLFRLRPQTDFIRLVSSKLVLLGGFPSSGTAVLIYYVEKMKKGACSKRPSLVRGVSCVLLGSTEAALMGNFTPISRRPAKCAMRIAWVHSGARARHCVSREVSWHMLPAGVKLA